MKKFDIYDRKLNECIKRDCTLEAVIEANFALSDDEVRKYYSIGEDNPCWDRLHKPSRVRRYVFDKVVIPDNPRFEMRPAKEDSYEETY